MLALGDSYTIGEALPLYENYPYQCVQLLRKAGYHFAAPEIIARTGWTTGELEQGIGQTILQASYDIVSLLIGVNNQYRGYPPEDYAAGFERLLQQAIWKSPINVRPFVGVAKALSMTPRTLGPAWVDRVRSSCRCSAQSSRSRSLAA